MTTRRDTDAARRAAAIARQQSLQGRGSTAPAVSAKASFLDVTKPLTAPGLNATGNRQRQRLRSIDALRGLAVLGMLLVNNAGMGDFSNPSLQHSPWHGFGVADQIYPCFLFIVGVCIAFSSRANEGDDGRARIGRILRRTAYLFLLGLVINAFPAFDITTIRVMGVLQRIGLAYCFASLAVVFLPLPALWGLTGSILLGYWVLMQHAFPGYDLSCLGNLAAALDRFLFTRVHLYFGMACDPEGLMATLPAIATVLGGYLTGHWLARRAAITATSLFLAAAGMAAVVVGLLWSLDFPFNKSLWTSSYTLFTTGWSLLLLAACYQLIEVQKWQSWSGPLEVLSANAILIYASSTLLEQWLAFSPSGAAVVKMVFERLLVPMSAAPATAALLFALILTGGWWLVAYALYRARIFVRI